MHGPRGGKVGMKCSILTTLIVLLRGQKAEIKVINGAISKTAPGIYGYLMQKTRTLMHPLLEKPP